MAARVRRVLAPVVEAGFAAVRRLPAGERVEHGLLRGTWALGSAETLDRYLVSGYQNPHVNVQSILARHVLLEDVIGMSGHRLMEDEIRFAIELNETLRRRAEALGVPMGAYRDRTKLAAVERVDAAIAAREHAFADRWRDALGPAGRCRVAVLELACGSANDYRAFAEYGLGQRLCYVGVDLSPTNVANARRRHPEARFEVGDILDLPYDDGAFDLVIASDIFEHLSPAALQRALDEAGRLARRALVFTFFNMADAPEHDIRRRRAYHWNTLSRRRIEQHLRDLGFGAILRIPVARWLDDRYDYPHSYNPNAWTIVAERQAELIPQLPHRWDGPLATSTASGPGLT